MNYVNYDSIIKFAMIYAEAVDQVATNRVKRTEIPMDYFSPPDLNIQSYLEKLKGLYYQDLKQVHWDKLMKRFQEEGYDQMSAAKMAEKRILELCDKQARKSIESHQAFLGEMRDMNIPYGSRVVAPGAGFAHEQVIEPRYRWVGLEYQKPLADMATERNKQLGISGVTRQWSFMDVDTDKQLEGDINNKINTISDENGNPSAMYLKHACGGITDGSLLKAVNEGVKYIFVATCCANRYVNVSYNILNPPITFEEYKTMAFNSKRQDDVGKSLVNKIDDYRQKFLERNGYRVERGINSHGPWIKAVKV